MVSDGKAMKKGCTVMNNCACAVKDNCVGALFIMCNLRANAFFSQKTGKHEFVFVFVSFAIEYNIFFL